MLQFQIISTGVKVELAFKQRMVGAIFILSLGVILIPVLFDTPHIETKSIAQKPSTPDMPDVAAVNEINYVFNDLESHFNQADASPPVEVAPQAQPETPQHFESLAQVESEPLIVEPDTHVTIEPQDNDTVPQEQAKPEAPKAAPVAPVTRSKIAAQVPAGDWTIQLGAFSSHQNASVLLKKLSQQGFESYVKDDKQRKLVRVFVAPGVNHDNAQLLLGKLDKQLGIKGMIVRFNDE